jgi:uncharacterized protein (UPF0276 family)
MHAPPARLGLPHLGLGVGLRPSHFPHLMQHGPAGVDWLEIVSENFIDNHGYAWLVLERLRAQVPVVMHGVSLSIGSSDPLDVSYVRAVSALARAIEPAWVSDHLCWTGLGGHNSHDLLPLPLTEHSLRHVRERVEAVQDLLRRPLVLENPSTYLEFRASTLKEPEFFHELCTSTGCGMLLDVNNVYVSSVNHGFDPEEYIRCLPHHHIVQLHVAGPSETGELLIDTHDAPVPARVWQLHALAQELTGGVSTLLEWDAKIPEFPELVRELGRAQPRVEARRA